MADGSDSRHHGHSDGRRSSHGPEEDKKSLGGGGVLVEFVVSRFREPLDWLNALERDLVRANVPWIRVTVVEKDPSVSDAEKASWAARSRFVRHVPRANVGRDCETHAALMHDGLDEASVRVALFAQANPFKYGGHVGLAAPDQLATLLLALAGEFGADRVADEDTMAALAVCAMARRQLGPYWNAVFERRHHRRAAAWDNAFEPLSYVVTKVGGTRVPPADVHPQYRDCWAVARRLGLDERAFPHYLLRYVQGCAFLVGRERLRAIRESGLAARIVEDAHAVARRADSATAVLGAAAFQSTHTPEYAWSCHIEGLWPILLGVPEHELIAPLQSAPRVELADSASKALPAVVLTRAALTRVRFRDFDVWVGVPGSSRVEPRAALPEHYAVTWEHAPQATLSWCTLSADAAAGPRLTMLYVSPRNPAADGPFVLAQAVDVLSEATVVRFEATYEAETRTSALRVTQFRRRKAPRAEFIDNAEVDRSVENWAHVADEKEEEEEEEEEEEGRTHATDGGTG